MFASVRFVPVKRLAVASVSRHICTSIVARDAKSTDGNKATPNSTEIADTADIDASEIPESAMLSAEPIDAKNSEDEPRKKDGERVCRGYEGWMITQSSKYEKALPNQTNFVSGKPTIPFPLNPWFRVRPPLSDQTKEQIYKAYLSDPVKNTPRVLGDKFLVSIKRVEAILKLKAIEHHMVKHDQFAPQKKLTAGMESMLAVSGNSAKLTEPIFTEKPKVSSPRFHAIPEGETFRAKDAAEVLGREPYQHIVDHLTASKPYVIDYEGLDPEFAPRVTKRVSPSMAARLEKLGPEKEEVLVKDPSLSSQRWSFVFTDISKHLEMKNRSVYVRERDGTLKKAGRDYKIKRYRELWKY
ncbi:eukaryotic mitochondrial regulator protein-domain-containing protein [Coemansia spiralis]|nr:eukaryotic mitochondrial regulator protein-domain-containing protein [Coemansia spiralis]